MLFRQLFDSASSTYTYLLACEKTKEAVLIDPVFEKFLRDAALIKELGLTLKHTIETHVHADHVTAGWLFKQELGSTIVLSEKSGAEGADVYVKDGDSITFGESSLEVRSTPGHTDGCVTYVTADHQMAFTGDAVLIRGAGRTDFQQGDAGMLFKSVRDKVFTLPDDCTIYPAHDYQGRMSTSVREEKEHNPRLGTDRNEGDFVGFMNNLGLAHPKQIDVAVPANLKCGRPDGKDVPKAPAWGPVFRTFAGVSEIEPQWVAENLPNLHILDVRTDKEFDGELSHIDGAQLITLDVLNDNVGEIPRDKPVVCVCRSGARSARATAMLEKEGFEQVANLQGGMIRWRALKLPAA